MECNDSETENEQPKTTVSAKKKFYKTWECWVIVAVALFGIYLYSGSSDRAARRSAAVQEESVETDAADQHMAVVTPAKCATEEWDEPDDAVTGLYDVKITLDGDEVDPGTMALIQKGDTVGSYTVELISEYDPEYFTIDVTGVNTFTSDALGQGKLSYKSSIDKTTITFVNKSLKWVFTK